MALSKGRLRGFAETIAAQLCADDVVLSDRVVEALRRVPCHRLVERFWLSTPGDPEEAVRFREFQSGGDDRDDEVLDIVYSDEALITRLDSDGRPSSSTSQPSLVAVMLEVLDLGPGMRVLEIGAGTGYNAALIAEIINDPSLVTTVDIQCDVVADARRHLAAIGYGGIRVLCRDGSKGAPEHAPFDRVVATVGCPDISWHWVDQLAPDGLMLVPLQHGGPNSDPLVRLHSTGSSHLEGRVVTWAGFMPLQGELGGRFWPEPAYGTTGPPTSEYELFPALAEAPLTMSSFRSGRTAWWDFAYFLALEDRRTLFSNVLELVDSSGSRCLVDDHGISVWGDHDLYDDLAAVYHRWERLGRPKLHDWHVRLTPRTTSRPLHGPENFEWVLDRPTSWQVNTLTPP